MRSSSLVIVVLALAPACDCNKTSSSSSDAATLNREASADADANEIDADTNSKDDDEVRPVYPLDTKPDPVAKKLCEALHAMPEKNRSSCCTETPGFTLASECTRVVSGALQLKAVTIEAAAIDRCVLDLEKVYAGCDWVGSHKIAIPESCEGIFRGTIRQGARCRSSLECGDGLRCAGVGPTDVGRCVPPGENGSACSPSIDVLDRYTRQQTSEQKHPPCKGVCDRHQCIAPPAVGTPCKASVSCGPGKACVNSACAIARGPQKIGEPCADGECAAGLYCIKGKCVGPQPAGADCSTEFECIGACLLPDGGSKGKCGKRCLIR